MFLAGTDLWHAAGRPDFRQLTAPPHLDLRAFAWAFYMQPLILLATIAAAAAWTHRATRTGRP